MNIVSWNINGLRAILKKDFHGFLDNYKPDVLGIQEIKIDKDAINTLKFSAEGGPASGWDFSNYQEFYNPAERKGYSGTASLVRDGIKAEYLERYKWDDEGRVQVLDLGKYFVVNIYFPNANHELSRLDFKIKFNNRLLRELKKLEQRKPLVVMGDYNVAHHEIDLARPKENVGNPGFHPRERAWMDKFIGSEFIDTFRNLHPEEVKYSWWSYRAAARVRNVGWRIDYVCVSKSIKSKVENAFIMNEVMGSDHCPVGIDIKY